MVPYCEIQADIKHLEEVLSDESREWSCDECRKDHERLLLELKELAMFRCLFQSHDDVCYRTRIGDAADNEAEKIYEAIQFVYSRVKWNGGNQNGL